MPSSNRPCWELKVEGQCFDRMPVSGQRGGLGGLSTKQLGTSVGQALRFCVLLPRSRLISFLQPTPAVGDCMKNVVLRTPALYCIVWKSRPPSLQVCGHAQTFGTSLWPVLSPVRFTSQAKKKLIPCLLCGMKSLVSFFIFARPCSESVVMPRPLARVCGLYCR